MNFLKSILPSGGGGSSGSGTSTSTSGSGTSTSTSTSSTGKSTSDKDHEADGADANADSASICASDDTPLPERTSAETRLLQELYAAPGNGAASGKLRKRIERMLLLERFLRSHDKYGKLFHDSAERGAITDDPELVLDLTVIYRFLSAKKFKYEPARRLIVNWIEWRLKERPHKITLGEVWDEYATGKGYWFGKDKDGLPIVVMRPYFHDPSKSDADRGRRYAIWVAEEGTRILRREKQDRFVVLYDASKISFKNLDMKMVYAFAEVFEMYPEYLQYAIVVPNFGFWALWKICLPLIDKTTRTKIRFLDSMDQLRDYIDGEHLERVFGGAAAFDFFESLDELRASVVIHKSGAEAAEPALEEEREEEYGSGGGGGGNV